MNAVVKYQNIKRIQDNRDGTVTIHFSYSLSFIKASRKAKGHRTVKLGDVYTVTVEKENLVDIYV